MSAALAAVSGVAVRTPRATRRATAAHGALLRRVRLGLLRRWFGMPLLVLETVGRRTGEPRIATLAYLPDGEDLVVVASNAGAARAPAWWLQPARRRERRRRPRLAAPARDRRARRPATSASGSGGPSRPSPRSTATSGARTAGSPSWSCARPDASQRSLKPHP